MQIGIGLGIGFAAPTFSVSDLFANGEDGAIYDREADGSLFQDAAKTTPATSTSDPVGAMADQSGNSNDFTQSTAGARPTLQAGGIRFDGVDDNLSFGQAFSGDFCQVMTTGIIFGTISEAGTWEYTKNEAYIPPGDLSVLVLVGRSLTDVEKTGLKALYSSRVTTAATNMKDAFRNRTDLSGTLDLSNFDTSSVTIMWATFFDCSATTLDLSNFDTSSVTTMRSMFANCSATTIDVSGFDTSSVTSMQAMFANCSATTIDVSGFDTSSATTMQAMFNNTLVATLDLSNFDTSSVTTMENMVRNCPATTIDVSGFDISALNGTDGLDSFMALSSMSTANYDATLIAWAAQTVYSGLSPDFGSSTYTSGGAAEAARASLINDDGWAITDGGAA